MSPPEFQNIHNIKKMEGRVTSPNNMMKIYTANCVQIGLKMKAGDCQSLNMNAKLSVITYLKYAFLHFPLWEFPHLTYINKCLTYIVTEDYSI